MYCEISPVYIFIKIAFPFYFTLVLKNINEKCQFALFSQIVPSAALDKTASNNSDLEDGEIIYSDDYCKSPIQE